jgi:hypothetical protein
MQLRLILLIITLLIETFVVSVNKFSNTLSLGVLPVAIVANKMWRFPGTPKYDNMFENAQHRICSELWRSP